MENAPALTGSAIQEIVKLSAVNAEVRTQTQNAAGETAIPYAIVPEGAKLLSLESQFPPQRIKQHVKLLDAGSFIDYVNRFKNDDTLIFANVGTDSATFTAIIDYHGNLDGEYSPEYCSHLATFTTLKTPDWEIWLAANRKEMDQLAFATWLEDNARLFVEPKGAELLEIVTTLEGKQDVRFTSGMRLQSGANELNYEEDVQLSAGSGTKQGKIKIPQTVTAGIAPFHGSAPYKVQARLKYRIQSRKITFWLETINLPGITRDALLLICKEIGSPVKPDEKGAKPGTGIIPLLGSAQ